MESVNTGPAITKRPRIKGMLPYRRDRSTLQIQDRGSVLVAVTFPCKVDAGGQRHDSPS